MFKYLKKSEIESLCKSNSVCRDGYQAFKEQHPGLVDRILEIYAVGFNYPRCHIKYELNYNVYDYMWED